MVLCCYLSRVKLKEEVNKRAEQEEVMNHYVSVNTHKLYNVLYVWYNYAFILLLTKCPALC